jgi:hypothetical protein
MSGLLIFMAGGGIGFVLGITFMALSEFGRNLDMDGGHDD